MDRPTIDRDNIIERFVLGQLTDAELDAFLTYQLFHPEIKTEVEALRAVAKTTRGLAPSRQVKWWQKRGIQIGLLLLTVVLGVALWQLAGRGRQHDTSPAAPQQQNTEPPTLITPGDTTETHPPPPSSRQIAADFRPNPHLEALLGPGRFRGNADEQPAWVKTPPAEQQCESAATMCRINLRGQLRGDIEAIKQFRWLLFSNKPADFTALRPLQSGSFSTKNNPDQTIGIDAGISLRLAPGLYYYLIEDAESGATYFTGKLTVR
ncbi:MAG: hypothetical protein JNL02_19520 [Saprospiraceae bacterium]|nr:hypothetical protein [Saprospiraceae bacterium]